MTKIHSTKEYDSFQSIPSNRKISQKFVKNLVSDKSFIEGFKYHPIVVDQDMKVIDGQHRLRAAKELNIPVHYIIQPNAKHDEIRKINAQQHRWENSDYLNYFVTEKYEEFVFLNKLKDDYKCSIYLINEVCSVIEDITPSKYIKLYKDGLLKFKHKIKIKECMDMIFQKLESIKVFSDRKKMSVLFSESYFSAFASIYLKGKKILEDVLNKLPAFFIYLPLTRSNSEAFSNLMTMKRKRVIHKNS
jgi:hypothetical protein